jgi:hypothetical protein
VVYIYRGCADGLKLSQKIVGSHLHSSVAGFGFSISRGQDIDGNGHNGLPPNRSNTTIFQCFPLLQTSPLVHSNQVTP